MLSAAGFLCRTFSHIRFRLSVKAHDPGVDKRARASRSHDLSPHIDADPATSSPPSLHMCWQCIKDRVTASERERAALARASQPPFRLLDLPAEIVGSVSDRLEDTDLLNLRRACRALNAYSANAFGKRFFHHLIVILHPTSLTTLLEICHHPLLSSMSARSL